MILEDNLKLSLLFELYGNMLTDKQKLYLNGYLFQNLSLTEIAELNSTSRQAVNDLIKRSISILLEYEEKMQLLTKFDKVKSTVEDCKLILKNSNIKELEEKLNNILEVL